MFDLSVGKLLVLAIVAVIVVGPDRLPKLAKDAAQVIRTLREMATGAREQLRDELGPEFADVDLRTLNPRTAIQRAVFGDELDLSKLDPRNAIRGDEDLRAADPRAAIRDTDRDDQRVAANTAPISTMKPNSHPKPGPARPMPDASKPYGPDAT